MDIPPMGLLLRINGLRVNPTVSLSGAPLDGETFLR
jgi:hypothetical protein